MTVTACAPTGQIGTGAVGSVAVVTWVYDGDTIVVETEMGPIDVRLVGVNAPEAGECGARESTEHMIETLERASVELEPRGLDQFGRTLAIVRDGGRNVNLDLVRLGLAIATTPEEPGFFDAEGLAAASGAGLWAADACSSGPIPDVRVAPDVSVFDPPGPDGEALSDEFVVISNHSEQRVNLSGWVVRDESSRHRYTFPGGSRLEPGQTLTISSADGGWDPGGTPVWNNDGDLVLLMDRHGRVVDHWRYGRTSG